MSTTLRDIAKIAGVTEATVSNAINGRGKMSDATREKIMTIVRQTGYTPNTNARNLAVSRSRSIGIVVPNLENPFYGSLVRRTVRLCEKHGYHALVSDSFESPADERKAISHMLSQRVEGLLIVPTNDDLPNADYVPLLKQNNTPFCYLANRIPGTDYPFVMTNLSSGTYMLVHHLLEKGCTNILFLVGSGKNPSSVDRIDGYRRAFTDMALPYREDSLIYCDAYDYDEACAKTGSLLETTRRTDAIITMNDFMAAGVLTTLVREKIAVPEQIAVAGYDDMFFSRISSVPLTTVRQNIREMCRIAMENLLSMINGEPNAELQVYLEPELILRASTP